MVKRHRNLQMHGHIHGLLVNGQMFVSGHRAKKTARYARKQGGSIPPDPPQKDQITRMTESPKSPPRATQERHGPKAQRHQQGRAR